MIRVAEDPRRIGRERRSLPCRRRNETRLFSRQLNTGLRAEPEYGRVLIEARYAKTRLAAITSRYRIEVLVRRYGDRGFHIDRPMNGPVVENAGLARIKWVRNGYRSGRNQDLVGTNEVVVERARGKYGFYNGPRGIETADHPVEKRRAGIFVRCGYGLIV